MAKARSSTRCPATAGSSSPTCACSYAWMWAHPGKKLLFMGGEFGQWREWNHERGLDWQVLFGREHAGLQKLVRDLNRSTPGHPGAPRARTTRPAASAGWMPTTGSNSIFTYVRQAPGWRKMLRGGQRHSGAARRLPHGCGRGRLLPRNPEHRQRDLQRVQSRQWCRTDRLPGTLAGTAMVGGADPAAAGDRAGGPRLTRRGLPARNRGFRRRAFSTLAFAGALLHDER